MTDPIRAALMDAFFARLRGERPESVLDVGCGDGWLLARCADVGIPAAGIEPGAVHVAALRDRGLDVQSAVAEALPFADAAFDWVTIRHVSHHLVDVRPALAEAFRVAVRGVLVAEPWLDLSLPCQRVAWRLDAWLDAQAERVGRVHRAPITAGEFLAAVPAGVSVSRRMTCHLDPAPRPPGYLAAETEGFLADLAPDDPARAELADIEAAARAEGLSYNGTMILAMRR